MKYFYLFLIISLISCNKEEIQKLFVVSEYNKNLEKYFQEAKKKNPELEKIREISLYDYPKGRLNFIFSKDNKIYYYEEEFQDMLCVWGLENQPIIKRQLSQDSLHTIKYQNIIKFLEHSKNRED